MVDGFWEETIVANGFLKDFYNSTIAIESMVLQSTIGDDGFSMVNEKRRWFSKTAIYDKKLLLDFKFRDIYLSFSRCFCDN